MTVEPQEAGLATRRATARSLVFALAGAVLIGVWAVVPSDYSMWAFPSLAIIGLLAGYGASRFLDVVAFGMGGGAGGLLSRLTPWASSHSIEDALPIAAVVVVVLIFVGAVGLLRRRSGSRSASRPEARSARSAWSATAVPSRSVRSMGRARGARSTGGEPRSRQPSRFGLSDLEERLGVGIAALRATPPRYSSFTIPKRSGGTRHIDAPNPDLKALQRTVLQRVLGRLPVHPAVHGFERHRSIVTNASPHIGRAVVMHLDLEDFFGSTSARRVRRYFRVLGWDSETSQLLTAMTTHGGTLPQGAPTSPRLTNLVNMRMDARLAALAQRSGAVYTRYADDLTFSFATDEPRATHRLLRAVKRIVRDEGYRVHEGRKLRIRRRHEQQRVTGLVVNERVALPRATRRWLRAVEHHRSVGRPATLDERQLAGWHALQRMLGGRPA